jgi:hypothetical protein
VLETKDERVDIRRSGGIIPIFLHPQAHTSFVTRGIKVKFGECWNDKDVKTIKISIRSIMENL